ncbi:aminoglycoside phosphotransferase family protein [Thiomicrorhabdus sp. Milos-T2]|uniref:aminoglycoside phosphotransferase family protein n=1 Tax=Thiomicrorhabdus sp. Milos-T2 TaxID=90814 RepID=UPI000494D012|nr:aminoglycoside phosphotransferase family protein [Thiomicrorhabdus sp. Milos-T2]
MKIMSSLYESLQFLLLDVQKQLQNIEDALDHQDPAFIEKSLNLMDYIDIAHLNLLQRARHEYQSLMHDSSRESQLIVQSYEHVGHALKALAKQLFDMAVQLKKICGSNLLHKHNVFSAFSDLSKGLSLVLPAIDSDSLGLSIDICRLQNRIHQACQLQIEKYKKQLRTGQQTDALLKASFILKDIDIMGDALLRVGEGIISANLGQFIQIDRYHALEASINDLKQDISLPDLRIHSMGETKSGCTISGVRSSKETEGEILAIFKEGKKQKLLEEKKGIDSWNKKFPGIAPEVYSYQKTGDKAALLFEYLTGKTFDKLLLQKERKPLKAGLKTLFVTLEDIWQQTRIDEIHPANYMQQLEKRLKNIYKVHPDFNLKGLQIGDMKQATLEKLVKQAAKVERKLKVPQAVYIHGDFNTDNILYDSVQQHISFIDLHRSEYLDYVQDLSVLMVSFYRMTNFDPDVRQLIRLAMEAIYDFGQSYAEKIQDEDYSLRMALGLGRSFITSTRFVFDKEHAKSMHFKGRYLIEQVIQLDKANRKKYEIPKEIFHD